VAEGDTPVTRLDPHADHDLLLVAEAADRPGQLPPTLAACPDCRTLHADLLALAAAVPTAALPARPRTYTLTQADADRLRAPAWRRWLGAVGTPRDAISRPLALGFTTIGLAGLLVATVPGALPSGGATGAAPAPTSEAPAVGEMAASAAPSAAPLAGAPEPAPEAAETSAIDISAAPDLQAGEDGDGVFSGADEGDAATSADPGSRTNSGDALVDDLAIRDDGSGLSTLFVLGGVLLIIGLGLFGLRWTARRLGDG
jgi:hypothetical protein